jgi:hypothetical protein
MKRCSRQKWLVKSQQDKADAVATSPVALSANVRKGADVLSEVLAEDSRATRIGLSAAARKAAETFARMPGAKVIKHAQAHRHMTASSSVLQHSDRRGQPGNALGLPPRPCRNHLQSAHAITTSVPHRQRPSCEPELQAASLQRIRRGV